MLNECLFNGFPSYTALVKFIVSKPKEEEEKNQKKLLMIVSSISGWEECQLMSRWLKERLEIRFERTLLFKSARISLFGVR